MKNKVTAYHLCVIAFCVVINIVGGQIALFARLPIACITAYLFGGITSSGSSALVQLLAHTPLGLTVSCFIVQVITDYFDRIVAFLVVLVLKKRLPNRKGMYERKN